MTVSFTFHTTHDCNWIASQMIPSTRVWKRSHPMRSHKGEKNLSMLHWDGTNLYSFSQWLWLLKRLAVHLTFLGTSLKTLETHGVRIPDKMGLWGTQVWKQLLGPSTDLWRPSSCVHSETSSVSPEADPRGDQDKKVSDALTYRTGVKEYRWVWVKDAKLNEFWEEGNAGS